VEERMGIKGYGCFYKLKERATVLQGVASSGRIKEKIIRVSSKEWV